MHGPKVVWWVMRLKTISRASGPSSWSAFGKYFNWSTSCVWFLRNRMMPFLMCGCIFEMRKILSVLGRMPSTGRYNPRFALSLITQSLNSSWNWISSIPARANATSAASPKLITTVSGHAGAQGAQSDAFQQSVDVFAGDKFRQAHITQ